jgi:2-C-methyl-D-erythritol 4-phosphate cytidylyltransferase
MNPVVILVAGGTGSRMGLSIPKQFYVLEDKPVLMHTIQAFRAYQPAIEIVLVLPEDQHDYWNNLCHQYTLDTSNIKIAAGGKTRFESSKSGLATITDPKSIVAIHDGVRPFVAVELIAKGFALAQELGTAVCSVNSKDSVRLLSQDGSNKLLERANVQLVQTPQIFQYSILAKAFESPEETFFTDDASVVENAGFRINLFEGSYSNIKITTPEDLIIAKLLVNTPK